MPFNRGVLLPTECISMLPFPCPGSVSASFTKNGCSPGTHDHGTAQTRGPCPALHHTRQTMLVGHSRAHLQVTLVKLGQHAVHAGAVQRPDTLEPLMQDRIGAHDP